jgi:hypothetical protein
MNTIALSKFFIPEHMLFSFHPDVQQESSALGQSKKYVQIPDLGINCRKSSTMTMNTLNVTHTEC